ncbi:hypothetical protein OQZ33_06985 [Pedobacter sp. MC2016-05]|uniref:hypothetical protein n=1 Tax=Pedobacter sp. MC2016-05 TaxID=2994474 RepID=UPI00224841E5|nr:hypothetical protein [Pedobacter sp. MC2016-05]MCX2474069.1 hypothetical protein [Pedobacter sp. MC2016-05]
MTEDIIISNVAYDKVFEALYEKYKWNATVLNSYGTSKKIQTELPVLKEMKATFLSHIEYLNQFITLIDEKIEG